MPKFEVPIVYRGQYNYIVEADTPEAASEIAETQFKNGHKPDVLGNEWETIEKIGEIEILPDSSQSLFEQRKDAAEKWFRTSNLNGDKAVLVSAGEWRQSGCRLLKTLLVQDIDRTPVANVEKELQLLFVDADITPFVAYLPGTQSKQLIEVQD